MSFFYIFHCQTESKKKHEKKGKTEPSIKQEDRGKTYTEIVELHIDIIGDKFWTERPHLLGGKSVSTAKSLDFL